jgi:hypothetical protein
MFFLSSIPFIPVFIFSLLDDDKTYSDHIFELLLESNSADIALLSIRVNPAEIFYSSFLN